MKRQIISSVDLIILGFLSDRAMNAYELTNLIMAKQIGRFLKISAPAIYKNCKRLHADNYLDAKVVKDGDQPEKVVYSLTPLGKKQFYDLMNHFSSNFTPFYLDCNAFIWNIDKMEKKQGLEMLGKLHDELLGSKTWITQHEKEQLKNMTFASRLIVKQYRMMINTLLDWIEDTVVDYKKIL